MNITNTISWLELVWTFAAIYGTFFTGKLVLRSYQDREWLLSNDAANGDRAIRQNVSTTSLFIFGGGFVTQFIYCVIGIDAMILPNSTRPLTLSQWIVSVLFIGGTILNSILAGLIFKRRTDVVKEILDNYSRREHD